MDKSERRLVCKIICPLVLSSERNSELVLTPMVVAVVKLVGVATEIVSELLLLLLVVVDSGKPVGAGE